MRVCCCCISLSNHWPKPIFSVSLSLHHDCSQSIFTECDATENLKVYLKCHVRFTLLTFKCVYKYIMLKH